MLATLDWCPAGSEHDHTMPVVLEFWPEYHAGPFWTRAGASVDLTTLPLPDQLRVRLAAWNARYEDAKLPFESNDTEWLQEGLVLLAEARAALGGDYEVVVTEAWWDDKPAQP